MCIDKLQIYLQVNKKRKGNFVTSLNKVHIFSSKLQTKPLPFVQCRQVHDCFYPYAVKCTLWPFAEALKLLQNVSEPHKHPILQEPPKTNQDELLPLLLQFHKLLNICLHLIDYYFSIKDIPFRLVDSKDKERVGDFSITDSRFCCSCVSFAFLA